MLSREYSYSLKCFSVLDMVRLVDGVYAVSDLPMVYIPYFSVLVIADIHLGFEEDMASKGVFLPRVQLKKAMEFIEKGLAETRARVLVIAGDVKHHFEKLGKREARDVREFFSFVTKLFDKVILVRGNHDTFIYGISKRYGIEVYDKLWLNDILVVHGHRELDPKDKPKIVIMGHEHPSISIRDTLGSLTKLPCFLVVPLKRSSTAIVLPAMGIYQSGTAISTSRDSYLSPILRTEAILEEAQPFAIVENEGVFELPKLRAIEDLIRESITEI